MIENHFMIAVHFFSFTTSLVTVVFQKYFETLFVKFRTSSAAGHVVVTKFPFLNFTNHFRAVDSPMTPQYTLQMSWAASPAFWP